MAVKPTPPPKPDYSEIYTSPTFTIQTMGECDKGTYVEIYVPDRPSHGSNSNLQVVIYLHGFALGAPEIYRSHLEHLVRQGYFVIYPNYQQGFCKFPKHQFQVIRQMVEEVLSPFPISPKTWMTSAIDSVMNAYDRLKLFDNPVETYLFGHSLGGLFALSWPYYAQLQISGKILPKQIVVADPIPDAQANIPLVIREIIKVFGGIKDNITIQETGGALAVPVAILHGNEDTIIPKKDWVKPFHNYIATPEKAMYLSFTDEHGSPGIYANHEEATVNTKFVPDWMAKEFLDGVGVEDNLNWSYIWYGCDRIFRFGTKVEQLEFDMGNWSDGTPVKPIQRFL